MELDAPPFDRSTESLVGLVQARLHQHAPGPLAFTLDGDLKQISAVLFLLGKGVDGKPFLILNKRSRHVRQPGDLCCPGGGISPGLDFLLARGLKLPATPFSRWPQLAWWRRNRPNDLPKLSLLLAAALREGLEEMRLNPFGVSFLGPLPAQQLVMFRRAIYPMVGWVRHQRRFVPNWEVDRIVAIPLASFFKAGNYARYRITFKPGTPGAPDKPYRDMPCFRHCHRGQEELLWGATYRITVRFLNLVFDFIPPPMETLPLVRRQLGRRYLKGVAARHPS